MPNLERIIITRAIHSGGGFAVRSSDASEVYIPRSVGPVDDELLQREFMAVLKEENKEGKVPLVATFVDWQWRIGRDPSPTDELPQIDRGLPMLADPKNILPSEMSEEELGKRLKKILADEGMPMRSRRIVRQLLSGLDQGTRELANRDQESNLTISTLQKMHARGEVVRADVYKTPSQTKVSFYLWGASSSAFAAF